MTSTLTNYTININVDENTPLGRLLNSWANALDRSGPLVAAATAAANAALAEAKEPAATGRSRKAAAPKEEVPREVITPPAAPAGPSVETLKALAQDVITNVGLDKVKQILAARKAARLSELDSKHYAAVHADLKAALEAKGALS